METTGPGDRGPLPGVVLGICCTSLGLTGLDTTIVNVALPSIGRDLHASVSGLQWIVAGYTVALTSCLLSSGTLADRFGRRRVFQAGLSAFALGSWLCSIAPSLGWLVAFRVLQGAGASMLNPAALGIIYNTFTSRAARARAIGVWDGVYGLSLALGPVAGGALTGWFGWRSVFWASIPVALIANMATAFCVPDSRSPQPRRSDPAGQLLVIVALGSLTWAIIEGPQNGWASPVTAGLLTVAVVAAAVLVRHELRRAEPLIDPRAFRQAPFATAVVTAVSFTACLAGFLFLTTLYLQDARGLSPLHAGLAMLPMPAVMAVCAPIAGRYVARHGARLPLLAGGCAVAFASAAIAGYLGRNFAGSFALPYALFGAGAGLCAPSITTKIMGGIPAARAAVASSIASASRQLGATLGTAITGTVLIAGLRGSLAVGYAHGGQPAWWVTAGFGAAIIPLTLTAAARRPAATGESPPRSVTLLVQALQQRWVRGRRPGTTAPQADRVALADPGPPPLHHDTRAAQPAAALQASAVALADPGPAALHHDTRAALQADAVALADPGPPALECLPGGGDAGPALDSRAVAKALASLSPHHRQVIVETYYRGHSVTQAAAALGIPAETVKARTLQALQALNLALRKQA